MTTPEPVDEFPAGAVETRGGDRPEDYIPPFATGGLIPEPPDPDDEVTVALEED